YITPTSRTDTALNFADIRFRRGPDVDEEKPKVRSITGHRSRLYCTTTLANPGSYVAIAEGEMDTLTLNQCGIPAVGVAGVSAWNSDYYDRIFSGFEKVIIPAITMTTVRGRTSLSVSRRTCRTRRSFSCRKAKT